MTAPAELWRIYFVPTCSYTFPLPKAKLVVVVCRDTFPRAFLINSEIDAWIEIDPEKLASQAAISAAEHPCLEHDSYIDCLDLFRFDDFELTDKRELVSAEAKQAIIEAVRRSKTIQRKYKKLILGKQPSRRLS